MTHILLIDPLEKLQIQKDSSLYLAHELAQCSETYVMFFEDLAFSSESSVELTCHSFVSKMNPETPYHADSFQLEEKKPIEFDSSVCVHMRLDPPVDAKYIRVLWMLKAWEDRGIKVVNSAAGILANNEKLAAYVLQGTIPTYVGGELRGFKKFVRGLADDTKKLIIKPLDLYQGIGVRSVSVDDENLDQIFLNSAAEFQGAVVVQPFCADILNGELRSIWYGGEHIGSINKVPKKGGFLANIARGATFEPADLPAEIFDRCQKVSRQFEKLGVPWLAFDVLDGSISEVNLTCPGLLVEVAKANQKNLAKELTEKILKGISQ